MWLSRYCDPKRGTILGGKDLLPKLRDKNMNLRKYQTVRKWFNKGHYKSEKRYLSWMAIICEALDKNPDEIISDIKASKFPITEMENQHVIIAKHFKEKRTKPYKARSTDMRTNALHSFYRANGIKTPVELLRQLSQTIWRTLDYKKE